MGKEKTETTQVSTRSRQQRWPMFRLVLKHPLAKAGAVVLILFAILAIFAPYIAPYDPEQILEDKAGTWLTYKTPGPRFWLGTTDMGRDILSQVIYGTRTAFMVGVLAAVMVVVIGTVIGLVAAYFGGWVDQVVMRLVDVVYGIPFLPFAMVLVTVLGGSQWNVIIAISVLLWRETCRVVRSQVLSLKERPFIEVARSSGAGHLRLIFVHLAPNVYPLSVLYGVFAVGWAIITEAGLSFLGFGDANSMSWGKMLQEAYAAQALSQGAWWWIIPPGIAIVLMVMSTYFIAQGIEQVVNPKLRSR
jgi:peptide/nickel transport system permease protein